ncbi:DUF397 domain-containing protein [Prauserella marina]|nr:DUF397 domain-containing protein [Prauserella marina]
MDAIGSVDDKVDLRAELDFGEAEWHTVPSSEDRVLELSFVPHTDGVTYVAMRQASSQESPVLVFTPSEWDAFLAGAREGQFDRENAG